MAHPRLVFSLVLPALLLPPAAVVHAQQTTSFHVGELPLVGNRRPIELATVHLEENYQDAWQDGTFSLSWDMLPNADMRLHFLEETSATGSVGDPVIAEIGEHWVTFSVDVEDDRIDSITVFPVVRIETDGTPSNDLITGTTYEIWDGQPSGTDWRDRVNPSLITETTLTLGQYGETFDLTAGREAAIHEGTSFTRTIRTATGQSAAPYQAGSNHPDIEASVSGSEVTITGNSPTERYPVHLTDSLDRMEFLFLTVLEDNTYPPLSDVVIAGGAPSTASMEVGAAPHWELTYLWEFHPGETFTVSAAIEPEAEHVGQAGELFVVAEYVAPNGARGWYYQDSNGIFYPWDGNLSTLPPAHYETSLSTRETFDIHSGSLGLGEYALYIGYMAEQGPLIHSLTPQRIEVTEAFTSF